MYTANLVSSSTHSVGPSLSLLFPTKTLFTQYYYRNSLFQNNLQNRSILNLFGNNYRGYRAISYRNNITTPSKQNINRLSSLPSTYGISAIPKSIIIRPLSFTTSVSSSSSSASTGSSSTQQQYILTLEDINTIRKSCNLPPLSSDNVSSISNTLTSNIAIPLSVVTTTIDHLNNFNTLLLSVYTIDYDQRSQLLLASMQTVIDLAYGLSSSLSSSSSSSSTSTTISSILGSEPFLSSILFIIQGFEPIAKLCYNTLVTHPGTHIPTLKADNYSVPTDQVILLGGTRLSELLGPSTKSNKNTSTKNSVDTDEDSSSLPYYEQRNEWIKELNTKEVHFIAPLLRILYQLTNISQDPINGGGGFAIIYSMILTMCIYAGSAAGLTACVRVLASRNLQIASLHTLNIIHNSRELTRRNELQANIQGSHGSKQNSTSSSNYKKLITQQKLQNNVKTTTTDISSSPSSLISSIPPYIPILAYTNQQWDTLLSGFTHLLISPVISLLLQYSLSLIMKQKTNLSSKETVGRINNLLLVAYPQVYLDHMNKTNNATTTASNNTVNSSTNDVTDSITVELIQDIFRKYILPSSLSSSPTSSNPTSITKEEYIEYLQLIEHVFSPFILIYASNNQLSLAVKYMDTCQALMQWLPLPMDTNTSSTTTTESKNTLPLPQPSAEIWEALIETCCRIQQPNRAKRILQTMINSGIKPTKRYVSIQANILVSLANKAGKELETFEIFQHVQQDIEKQGYRLPASAYIALMDAMLRIQDTDKCYQVLRMAQSKGILRSIDNELLTKGIINLSGLPSSLLSFILYESLRKLRIYVIEKQGESNSTVTSISTKDSKTTTSNPSYPTNIRIYHRAADRLHIRGLLQSINPPLEAYTLGKNGKERYLFIDNTNFQEWLNTSV